MTAEGLDNIEVQKIKEDWVMALMQKGIIVKLSISRWGASTSMLPEDLGIKFANEEAAKFAEKYLTLGTQRLFPPEVMREVREIENKARRNLSQYSYDTIWGRFVPITVFDEWKKNDMIIRNDFMSLAKIIEQRYDEIIKHVRVEYSKLAEDTWARLYPEDKSGPAPGFVASFVDNVIAKIPNAFMISNSFNYRTIYYTIPIPSVIASDMVKANEIMQKAKMEDETRKKLAEQFMEQKKELIDNFFEATVKSMRRSIRRLCEGVLRSLEKNSLKEVSVANLNRLNIMVDHIRKMNFYNDTEITQLLNDLENEISKYKGDRDDEIITSTLNKIIKESTKDFLPDDFNPSIDTLEIE